MGHHVLVLQNGTPLTSGLFDHDFLLDQALNVLNHIETFDDPETGQPTQYGRFSCNWQDEEALDVLIDKLETGQLSHKQALMQARKLEATDVWPGAPWTTSVCAFC